MDNFIAHILVVDDDDGIRSLVKKYLNENNYLITTAQNAEEAITKIKLIKLEIIFFKKDDQDTRIKHIFLNEKGERVFTEIFEVQKKRIHGALLNSSSEEVVNFDKVLKKIING